MEQRSPLVGFNHNILHRGWQLHVQTEDSGIQRPHLYTHLFHAGTILATKKMSYDPEQPPDFVRKLMQEQHKAVLRELKRGEHDAYIARVLGAPSKDASSASLAPVVDAPAAAVAAAATVAGSAAAAPVHAAGPAASETIPEPMAASWADLNAPLQPEDARASALVASSSAWEWNVEIHVNDGDVDSGTASLLPMPAAGPSVSSPPRPSVGDGTGVALRPAAPPPPEVRSTYIMRGVVREDFSASMNPRPAAPPTQANATPVPPARSATPHAMNAVSETSRSQPVPFNAPRTNTPPAAVPVAPSMPSTPAPAAAAPRTSTWASLNPFRNMGAAAKAAAAANPTPVATPVAATSTPPATTAAAASKTPATNGSSTKTPLPIPPSQVPGHSSSKTPLPPRPSSSPSLPPPHAASMASHQQVDVGSSWQLRGVIREEVVPSNAGARGLSTPPADHRSLTPTIIKRAPVGNVTGPAGHPRVELAFKTSEDLLDAWFTTGGVGGVTMEGTSDLGLGQDVELVLRVDELTGMAFEMRGRVAWKRGRAAGSLGAAVGVEVIAPDAPAAQRLLSLCRGEAPSSADRQYARVDAELGVKVTWNGATRKERALDVSEGGLFIPTAALIPVGDEVEVTIRPPRSILGFDVRGRVTWHRETGAPGMGLQFLFDAPAQKQRVVELVRKLAQ